MNKLILMFFGLYASTTFAHPFTGLYIMGGAGGTSATFENDQVMAIHFDPSLVDLDLPSEANLYADSFSAVMEVGYSYAFQNHAVLAAGISANYSNIKVNSRTNGGVIVPGNFTASLNNHLEISLTNDFALLFKPGYLCGSNTLLYSLIGPRWANIHSNTHVDFDLTGGGTAVQLLNGDAEGGYELGFTVGAGIKQVVSERLSVGLEYAYTTYGEISAPDASFTNNLGGTLVNMEDSHELDVRTNTLFLTLTYRS